MKYTFDCCTVIWGNLVTWRSKEQGVVAKSNAEPEYKAMSSRICEKIWLQKILSDFHQDCEISMKSLCDNKAAISIANNPVQHNRIKHVEIDRHFIKEMLVMGAYAFYTFLRANRLLISSSRGFSDKTLVLC